MTVTADVKTLIAAISDDGGYSSRKFSIAIIAMLVIVLASLVAGNWPAFGPQYPTAVWGIVTIAVGYMGGNVAARYVTGKTAGTILNPAGTAQGAPPVAPIAVVVEPPLAPPGPPQGHSQASVAP